MRVGSLSEHGGKHSDAAREVTFCSLLVGRSRGAPGNGVGDEHTPSGRDRNHEMSSSMGLRNSRELCGRETSGIDRAHMALDGVGNAFRVRQRAHMAGVDNLVMSGMGQSLAED